MHKDKDKLIEWETTDTIYEETTDIRGKAVSVKVEMQRPVYEGKSGGRRKGREKLAVVVGRAEKSFFFNFAEAKAIYLLLGFAIGKGQSAFDRLEKEFKDWRDRQNMKKYKPGPGRGPQLGSGKTDRKKKHGKAGADYHRRKKAERAQRDREIARDMGAGKKKGG